MSSVINVKRRATKECLLSLLRTAFFLCLHPRISTNVGICTHFVKSSQTEASSGQRVRLFVSIIVVVAIIAGGEMDF